MELAWPEHLCAAKGNGGFHCHLTATLLVIPHEPTLAKAEEGHYVQVCRQHVAKAVDDTLAAGAGWASVVSVAKKGS